MSRTNMVHVREQFVFDDTVTTLTKEIQENGWLQLLKANVPNFTNAITATLTISDRNGNVLYTNGTPFAKNATTTVGDSITAAELGAVPLDYRYTANITLSGAAGGTGGTVYLDLYIKK